MKLTERLSVIAANIESLGKSPPLLALIREHEPDVVVIEQAYNARAFLRGIGGYRLRQYRGTEAKGIAVLVKHGVRIEGRRPLQMRLSWNGPASKGGRRHPPRTYPSLRLTKGGVTFRVLGIHFPTFNNPAAQAESAEAVEEWFNHSDLPAIAAGDWNREAHQLEPIARGCSAEVLTGRTKVDHAMTKNVEHGTRRPLPMPPGPHGWAKYTIQATKEN